MRGFRIVRTATVLIGCLFLGYGVLAITMDRVFAASAPAVALFWNPGSADANVAAADALLQEDGLTAARAAEQHARRAALREPVNPGAARLLGTVAESRGEHGRAASLFDYAERTSRRDLATELWLIESSVRRGDVQAALLHYDRAMRTQRPSWPLLFPVLAQAAEQQAIWEPLSVLLARRPVWWLAFVNEWVPLSKSPAALYAIAMRTGAVRGPLADPGLRASIEQRLVDLKAYDSAMAIYQAGHGLHATGPLLRNGQFDGQGGGEAFDWSFVDEADLSAQLGPSPLPGGRNALFLTAANGRGGDLAKQTLLLKPGRYDLSGSAGAIAGDPLSFPQIIVQCLGNGRELVHQVLAAAPPTGRKWSATVTVPADCPAQQLIVRMNGGPDPVAAPPWLDDIDLRPSGSR